MKDVIIDIENLMLEITKLPEDRFDTAVVTVAVIAVNTLRDKHGVQFIKDFMEAAISDEGDRPVLVWQGPQH